MDLTQTLGTFRKLSWKLSGSIRNFHESFQEASGKLSCYVGIYYYNIIFLTLREEGIGKAHIVCNIGKLFCYSNIYKKKAKKNLS